MHPLRNLKHMKEVWKMAEERRPDSAAEAETILKTISLKDFDVSVCFLEIEIENGERI